MQVQKYSISMKDITQGNLCTSFTQN